MNLPNSMNVTHHDMPFANAFKFGLQAGRTSGVTPLPRSRRRKAAV